MELRRGQQIIEHKSHLDRFDVPLITAIAVISSRCEIVKVMLVNRTTRAEK
jgi:hypothetical protein